MSLIEPRWQVRTSRPVHYDLIKTPGLFAPDNDTLLQFGLGRGSRRFVVIDDQVLDLHGERIRAWFDQQQIDARIVPLAGGEDHKTLDVWARLARQLDDFPVHRRDEPLIAIGGGVLTDVVGFLAASYRRGLPHIKIPTTLMGYIDAAVGVKNGINLGHAKNRLGSFEPPLAVLLDKEFLSTQSRRHLLNGVCEIIKLAVICDAELFALLECEGRAGVARHFSAPGDDAMLDAAIGGMLAELEPNLFEDDLARRVDFGHSFSYGLEAVHADHLLHGEAVLLDVLVSVIMASQRQLLPQDQADRVFALVRELGIHPPVHLLDVDAMWHALQDRVMHRNGQQRLPMPPAIGQCVFINDITRPDIVAAVDTLCARMEASHESVIEC